MGNVLISYEPKKYIEQFADKQDIDILYETIFQSIEWIQLDRGSIEEKEAKCIFYDKLPERLHMTVDDILNNWHENLHGKNEMFYLVKQLKSKGFNLYLLSNTSKRFYHYCKKIPALSYFDGMIISADELLLKPDLDIYRRLLDKYRLVPEECFFIDDYMLNVEAAIFLGMDGFVYKNNIKSLRRRLSRKGVLDKDLQAVIFDLDGILVSTDEMHYKAWNQLAEEIDIPFDSEKYREFRGVSRMKCLELLLDESKENYSDAEKAAMAKRKNDLYLKYLQSLSEENIYEGARELLEELQANGILTAVASSSKNAYAILEKTALLPLVDIVADGNEIAQSKPDPEVFKLAADKLGVPYESCVVIEDAKAGIQAAKSGNMRAIGVGQALKDCTEMDSYFPQIKQITLETLKRNKVH
ncbi:MAG: beta-phosphoglucomutase [Tepidanaerobacter acetatoxydans]|nr:beta-phosphoglucomutase [Tepidanaerobacter acetatoxydans]NLU10831.1 beta-phosphoglucomutase [Tepidanaerobacter acetatoxydans]